MAFSPTASRRVNHRAGDTVASAKSNLATCLTANQQEHSAPEGRRRHHQTERCRPFGVRQDRQIASSQRPLASSRQSRETALPNSQLTTRN
jgi:hypothetical protein